MTSGSEELASSSSVAPPGMRSGTPKLVVWVVSVLGALSLLAASYKNAVEALSEANHATRKALAAEPVAEASYNELAKTINQLSEQLKATQSELALLADYVRKNPGNTAASAAAAEAQRPVA